PTWSADLADHLVRLARSDLPPGVYHAASSGETTWYGLAREVFALLGEDPDRVRPVPSAGFPRPARRPANSLLASTRTEPLRPWRDALHAAWPVLHGQALPGGQAKGGVPKAGVGDGRAIAGGRAVGKGGSWDLAGSAAPGRAPRSCAATGGARSWRRSGRAGCRAGSTSPRSTARCRGGACCAGSTSPTCRRG